jgi:hypothetical protein
MAECEAFEVPGVDASANNVGWMPIEPIPGLPAGCLGYFRWAYSVEKGLSNLISVDDEPAALADALGLGAVPTLTTDKKGFIIAATRALYVPGFIFDNPCTIITVFDQPAANPVTAIQLGGYTRTSAAGTLGMALRTSGVYSAWANPTAANVLTDGIAMAGGARTEMIVGRWGTNRMSVTRPRTGTKDEKTGLTMPTVSGVCRLFGDNSGLTGGGIAHASAVWLSELSDSDVTVAYNAIGESLLTADINIG